MSERLRHLKHKLLARHPGSRLSPISPNAAQALEASYEGIPEDYIALLVEVGWGSIGDGHFMLYAAPIGPAEVFGADVARSLSDVVLLGDDFAGHHAAYDTSTRPWRFIELEHTQPAEGDRQSYQGVVEYLEVWCGD